MVLFVVARYVFRSGGGGDEGEEENEGVPTGDIAKAFVVLKVDVLLPSSANVLLLPRLLAPFTSKKKRETKRTRRETRR